MSTGRGTRKKTSTSTNNVTTTKISPENITTPNKTTATETPIQNDDNVPNVLFAPDGRKFFPCKHCCRAFAFKRTLTTHLRTCTYRVVEVSDSEDESENPQKQKKTYKKSAVSPVKSTKNGQNITRDYRSVENDCEKASGINILTNVVVKEKTTKVPVISAVKSLKSSPKARQTPKKTKTFSEQLAALSSSVTLTPIDKKTPQAETFQCKKCNQIFNDNAMLLRHQKAWHKRKTIQLSPESLKIYDRVFMASNKNICPVCQKPQSRMGWKRHLQTHSTEFRFFCRVCKKGFKRVDHKKSHEKRHVIAIDEV